jgi:hypothetical protein
MKEEKKGKVTQHTTEDKNKKPEPKEQYFI